MNAELEIAELKARLERLESVVGSNLKDLRIRAPLALRVKAIQIEIATAHQFRLDDLLGECREKNFVQARWLAIYLAWVITKAKTCQLARLFRRDHGSISYALRRCRKRLQTDTDFAIETERWLSVLNPETKNENQHATVH